LELGAEASQKGGEVKVTLSQIADEFNLEKAWVRAKYWAQTFDVFYDAEEYGRFERHLTANLKVAKSLVLGGYEPGQALGITVPKEDGHRVLYHLGLWDNLVSMALLNMLIPSVEKTISLKSSNRSFGNRFHVGDTKQVLFEWRDQHAAFAARARELGSLPEGWWYVKSDISDYYPSINVELVLALVSDFVDEDCYELIVRFLHMEGMVGCGEHVTIHGLPIGPAHSALFANLYLSEFDEWMLARTDYYVRYVDDFFYAASSREAAKDLSLGASQWLSEIGLHVHPKKTERYAVTDTACIDGTIRRLKYDLRVETAELRVAGSQDRAQSLLYEAFVDSEYYEHPRTAAFLAWRLREMGYADVDGLTDMVCRVIEAGGLTVAQLRRLLTFIIENNQSQLPVRLVEYLRSKDDTATRLIALDLLSDYPECAGNLPAGILAAFTQSGSFLVRAYAYQTLGAMATQEVDVDGLRASYAVETSTLVRAKIVALMVKRFPEQVVSELPRRMRESSGVRQAILSSVPAFEPGMVRAVVAAVPAGDVGASEFSMYVYLLLRHSLLTVLETYLESQRTLPDRRDRDEALVAVATDVFADRLSESDHLGCLELVSVIGSLDPDLAAMSIHRLEHQLRPPSASVTERLAERLDELVSEIAPKTSVWSLHTDSPRVLFLGKYRFHDALADLTADSSGLYLVECLDTNRNGILEIIPCRRLEAHGLSSGEFHTIVDRLSRKGICTDIVKGDIELASGLPCTWVVYLYPDSTVPLQHHIECTWNTTTLTDKIAVVLDVAEKARESGVAEGMQSIHGRMVVIDNDLRTYLCAIGTSIVETPYWFSFSEECGSDGLGSANLSFCFGMLLLEYITGESGYEALQPTRREQGSLSEMVRCALPASAGVPHLEYVIDRATHRLLDHRYTEVRSLTEDLAHIKTYLGKFETLGLRQPATATWPLVVADYVEFLFNIASRSPGVMRSAVPRQFRRHVYDQLLRKVLGLLAQQPKTSKPARLGIPCSIRMSSPAAEQLVKLAERLWYLIAEANLKFGSTYPFRVPMLVLARLLDFESAATAYSLVSDLSSRSAEVQACASALSSWAESAGLGDAWVGALDALQERVSVDVVQERGKRLEGILKALGSPQPVVSQLGDTVDVALLALLRTRGMHVEAGSTSCALEHLSLVPPISHRSARELLLLASALEPELARLFADSASDDAQLLLRNQLVPTLRMLRRVRRSIRHRGRVRNYDKIGQQQGEFEWRQFLFARRSCVWRMKEVVHIGYEPWSTDRQMRASIDISETGTNVLAVMTPVSQLSLLALDSPWVRGRLRFSEHRLRYLLAACGLVMSALLLVSRMIPYGILALVVAVLLLLFEHLVGTASESIVDRFSSK